MVFKIETLKTSMLKTRMNEAFQTLFRYEENKYEKTWLKKRIWTKNSGPKKYEAYKLFIAPRLVNVKLRE